MYQYNFDDQHEKIRLPHRLAIYANREAKRIFKLIESWKVAFAEIKNKINQPKMHEIIYSNDHRVFIDTFLSLCFAFSIFVEFNFSYRIYESESESAILLFLGMLLAGLYCSASFASIVKEYITFYNPRLIDKELFEIKYVDEKNKRFTWSLFHPINGIIVFLLMEAIIYVFSQRRVELQQVIDSNSIDDSILALVFFGLSCLFGIGIHDLWQVLRIKKRYQSYQKKLSQDESHIEQMIDKCIDAWNQYCFQMDNFERRALEDGSEIPARIEPNRYLQILIDQENDNGWQSVIKLPPALAFPDYQNGEKDDHETE